MKKIIQVILILIILIITIIFYNKYFSRDNIDNSNKISQDQKEISADKKNLIKNLRYDVNLQDNSKYIIEANESELVYEDGIEIVKMSKVTAKFIDKNNYKLVIVADNAIFNTLSYNTKFQQNVTINYKDNTIFSENLDLNFTKNIVKIYNNVVYEGLSGLIKADNVKINLVTKNAEIFMNNLSKKIIGVVKN